MRLQFPTFEPGPDLVSQLDDLLAFCWLPVMRTGSIQSVGELPVRMERIIRSLAPDVAWRAYGDARRQYCAIGRFSHWVTPVASARWGQGPPAAHAGLEVYFLDGSSTISSAGVWSYDGEHRWELYSTIDMHAGAGLPAAYFGDRNGGAHLRRPRGRRIVNPSRHLS